MRRAAALAAILVGPLSGASSTADRAVAIPGKLFEPERLEVLVGDTVTWTNSDAVTHTVTADDGSFDSGDLEPGGTFFLTFDRPARLAYHCAIHRFMTGRIDVFALPLSGPLDPVPVGAQFRLRGLAPAGSEAVSIERRDAGGRFVLEATATVSSDGRFGVSVVAETSSDYRATVRDLASPVVHVRVSPLITLHVARGRVVEGEASPAQAGLPGVVEVYSRERFDWLPFAQVRFDSNSRVRFRVSSRRKLHLRLVLLRASPGLVPGISNVVVVSPRR
jgi:plastocyanin